MKITPYESRQIVYALAEASSKNKKRIVELTGSERKLAAEALKEFMVHKPGVQFAPSDTRLNTETQKLIDKLAKGEDLEKRSKSIPKKIFHRIFNFLRIRPSSDTLTSTARQAGAYLFEGLDPSLTEKPDVQPAIKDIKDKSLAIQQFAKKSHQLEAQLKRFSDNLKRYENELEKLDFQGEYDDLKRVEKFTFLDDTIVDLKSKIAEKSQALARNLESIVDFKISVNGLKQENMKALIEADQSKIKAIIDRLESFRSEHSSEKPEENIPENKTSLENSPASLNSLDKQQVLTEYKAAIQKRIQKYERTLLVLTGEARTMQTEKNQLANITKNYES